MNILKAKHLKVGDIVECPPDRGDPGYSGGIAHVSEQEQTHMGGKPFIWVTVKRCGAHASAWPSNRIG